MITQLIWSCGMAMPACCMAFAAYWARAGAVGGVHGAGVQVAGPALAWVEAIRAPTCTELETETTSRMYSDISMIPNRTSASSGVSKAASTAAAPRWSRGFLTAASLSHLSERWQRKQARVRRSGRKVGRWTSFYLLHGFFALSPEAHHRERPGRSRPVEALSVCFTGVRPPWLAQRTFTKTDTRRTLPT